MLQQFNDALSSVAFDLFMLFKISRFIKGDRLNIEIFYYFTRESSTLSMLLLKRSVQNLNMLHVLLKLLFLKTFLV